MTEREEDLLCLIEVMKNEVFLMGQSCFDAKVIGRYELAKLARDEGVELEDLIDAEFISGYDQALEKTVERIENIIRLASDRVTELTGPRVCKGD